MLKFCPIIEECDAIDLQDDIHRMLWLRSGNYRIAQNFGGRKLWRNRNCKKIGGENFGGWQRQSPSLLELTRSPNVLADKTLADRQ